jgi:hypothetical protein
MPIGKGKFAGGDCMVSPPFSRCRENNSALSPFKSQISSTFRRPFANWALPSAQTISSGPPQTIVDSIVKVCHSPSRARTSSHCAIHPCRAWDLKCLWAFS